MIHLDYRDAKPIYEQVKQGLRRLIISQALAPDEKLPSVRELAARLAINPNTIQRAYRELESEGYLYSIPGKGSFAAKQPDISTERQEALLAKFDEIVSELLFLSCEEEVLTSRIKQLAERSVHNDKS